MLGLKLEYIHTYMAEHGCLATTLFLAFRFYISASTLGQQPRATLNLFLASVCWEMSKFTMIALQLFQKRCRNLRWSPCNLGQFTPIADCLRMRTLLQRLQFSWVLSKLRELQLKICPNIWFNYMYWEGHLKSKTVSEPCATHCIACLFYSGQKETYFFRRSTLFPLLRDNYYFFSECFFQNYDQNHFFVKDRKKRTSSTQGEIKNAVKRSRADTSLASHPWNPQIV